MFISCLCPGDTDTNFFTNAGGQKLKSAMPSKTVAQIAVRSMRKRKAIIFPKQVKLLALLPKGILAFAVAKLLEIQNTRVFK